MTKTAPVMPAQSIDFNALHDALAKGESDEAALAKATGARSPERPKTVSSEKADKKGL